MPIPGVKPGFSNIITLFVLYLGKEWSGKDAGLILAVRILLGALIMGQPMTLIYSLAGGLSALFSMLILRRAAAGKKFVIPAPILSVTGALFHNTAQILTAAVVLGSVSVFAYFPALIFSGILSGLLTGFAIYFLYKSRPRFIEYFRCI